MCCNDQMQVKSYDFVLCCSVKPAIFDLFLAVAIVGYLAVVYLAVQVCKFISISGLPVNC